MTAQDKITRAEQVRQQGNVTFKLGQLQKARQKYLKALKLLDNAYDAETDEQVERRPLCCCVQPQLPALLEAKDQTPVVIMSSCYQN